MLAEIPFSAHDCLLPPDWLGLQARHAFLVNVGVLGSTAVALAGYFGETLPTQQRTAMDWLACNPLNFLSLLRASRSMFWLMVTSALQTCIDGQLPSQQPPAVACVLRLLATAYAADHVLSRTKQFSPSWRCFGSMKV